MAKIVIIGAGTWGLAVSSLLSKNGHNIHIYTRNASTAKKLSQSRTCDKLSGFVIDERITITSDLKFAIEDADTIVMAVPSIAFREVLKKAIKYTSGKEYFISLTKGMEAKTLYTMSEIIEDELGKKKYKTDKVAVLSGPTHAEEIVLSMPSMAVASSKSINTAKYVQDIFMNKYFRVYTNRDIKGVEICAAFKNIIGLASGVVAGLGYGDNIRAAVVTRGLAEMVRVGAAIGCKKDTFYGLAGLGDMVVTATSTHSRNYRCGEYIGMGYKTSDAIKKVDMVVEGINFIPIAIKIKKKYDLELPITEAMNGIVFNGKDPNKMLSLLMSRSRKSE